MPGAPGEDGRGGSPTGMVTAVDQVRTAGSGHLHAGLRHGRVRALVLGHRTAASGVGAANEGSQR